MNDCSEHRKAHDLLRRLPVPRGRIVVAMVLLTTMLLMWGRLLFSGKSGESLAAMSDAPLSATAANQKPQARIMTVQLPMVPGRHDRLNRDYFAAADWQAFQAVGPGSFRTHMDSAVQQELTENEIRLIEQNIKLDGIIAERNTEAREAFINGRLVSVGDVVKIEHKTRQLSLTVEAIQKNKVILGLENFTLNVSIPQADSLNK